MYNKTTVNKQPECILFINLQNVYAQMTVTNTVFMYNVNQQLHNIFGCVIVCSKRLDYSSSQRISTIFT